MKKFILYIICLFFIMGLIVVGTYSDKSKDSGLFSIQEYKVVIIPFPSKVEEEFLEDLLNDKAKDGWKLILLNVIEEKIGTVREIRTGLNKYYLIFERLKSKIE